MENAPLSTPASPGFGLGAHVIDDRLRLVSWAASEHRFDYLWILRTFDRARQAYEVRLTVSDVGAGLAELADTAADVPVPTDLVARLDALVDWGVLDRSQETGRVSSIAEYRRRNSVYQLTELGFLSHGAVERVVRARPDDAQLRVIALGSILEDLGDLAESNRQGDEVRVHLLLDRLHGVLTDLADRAARFYLMIGELGRVEEAKPEVFLRHKDLLLAHLREFHIELQRYAPLITAAIAQVRETGEEALVEAAATADPAPFATPSERATLWQERWGGLVSWFVGQPGERATVERLDDRTTSAIADLAALLRQVTEARRSGVSRDAQLRHLAAWCWATASDGEAAALWSAASGWRSARHLSLALSDADAVRPDRSWWTAPPVQVPDMWRERGQAPSPGRPAPIRDDARARAFGRARQLAARRAEADAGTVLAGGYHIGRPLDQAETALLLRLLDRALQSRSVVSGRVHGSASVGGLRLRLRPDPSGSVVHTADGDLTLPEIAVELQPIRTASGAGTEGTT